PAPAPSASPEAVPAPAPADIPPAAPAPAPSAPPAAARAATPAPPAHPPMYLSMDFTDVELPVLIKFMSEQTRKNFIFDERVQGKITIISPRRVTLEEAYDVFLYVLQAKGFTTVTQGNTIKIVAAREARQDTIHTGVAKDTASAEFITRLVPLQYLESVEVVPLVTPLVSKDGMVSAFGSSNTLLLIDSRANIERIVKIIGEVDNEGPPGILRVYPLAYAVAADVAKTLTSIYLEGGPAAPGPQAGRAPRGGAIRPSRGIGVKFLPDARTNSVIVYAGQEMQDNVADLLKKIDVPASAGGGKINVYYLENADAEEVSKVLASLSKERTGAPGAPTPAPGARPAPLPATGAAVVSAELEGGVKVTADKATNALIIVASSNDYETLVGVIKKLDIRRRQVFVEAAILEINIDKALDFGVEWRGAAQVGGGTDGAVIGVTNFDFQGNINNLFTSLATGNPLIFPGTGLIGAGLGGSVTLPDGTKIPAIAAVLRAAQTHNNLNVLSSPHLLTQNNKEAEIIVGENVPFITSQSRDSTNLANVINTVERKDVGITLRITPHIHESEFVSMDIYQESSALKDSTLLQTSEVGPTTTKRSAKTTVLVKSGDTMIIGGMMQETVTKNVSKVPLLGDIPLLGYLFKFTSNSKKKTNLVILLTPHIIQEPGEISRSLEERQRRLLDPFDPNQDDVKRALPGSRREKQP
ncbi:MAG TPA: type II secretion system secretin GspD, partial [Candidatus Deferrimicrobium sp.]